MEAERTLQAYINSTLVGILTDNSGVWSFTYTPEWVDTGYALSPALPLRPKTLIDGSTHRPVQNFFDNLLPEEAARQLMAKDAKVDVADRFALLAYYGAETAGAIALLNAPPQTAAPDQYAPLSHAQLSERIQALPQVSLNAGAKKRMSLAGAQHKLAVCYEPKQCRFSEPVGASPSTHILKPNHHNMESYSHSVVNEWFVMSLAQAAGLDVPPVYYVHVPEAVYIIKRFDRHFTGGTLHRRHTIDGCQMLQLPPESKYRQCTLDNLLQLANKCNQPALTRRKLFFWLLFNYLTGNGDAHLKNLSFYCGREGYELTPFYDLLNTSCYTVSNKWMETEMVTPLNQVQTYAGVNHATLMAVAKMMRIGAPKNVAADITRFSQRVYDGARALYEPLEQDNATKEAALQLTTGEFRHLRTLLHGPIADAHQQLT